MGIAACSSESSAPDPNADAQELRFLATADTRAAIANSTTIKDTPFEVYGEFVSTSDPTSSRKQLFDATTVTYTDGAWSYANPEYWMPGNTYSFLALHPAGNVEGITDKDYDLDSQQLSFTYTLPSDYTRTTDLLAATHRRQYTLGSTPTAPVSFNFSHLLARLNFTVRVDPSADDPVTIHRLTLRNVGVKGTFSFKPASLGSGTETNDYEDGTWVVEAPSEDENNPDELFTITDAGNDCLPAADLTIAPGLSRPLFRANYVAAANAADGKNHPANPLFILPQEVSTKTEMEIEYSVGGSDPITATASLYSITVENHGGKWEKGKSYTYTFTLGADEFIIYTKPTVDEWNPDEGGNYVIID